MRYILFSLIFLLLLYTLYFTKSKLNNIFTINSYYTIDSKQSLIWIHNYNSRQVEFNFSLNNKFYSSLNNFILKNTKATKTEQKVIDMFNATTTFLVHSEPFNHLELIPIIRLNSLGFGFCGRQSNIFSQICSQLGLKSRIIFLNGHFVSEVCYNEEWHLFDVDRKLYFKSSNNIASYDDFIKHSDDLIRTFVPTKISHLTVFLPSYKQMFSSEQDNEFKNIDKCNNDTFLLNLPPHASFIFPFPPDYQTDFYPYNSKAKLFLPKNYTGTIKNPLVLIDVEGEGIVTYNNRNYKVPEQRELLKLAIFNSKKFIDYVHVNVYSDSLGLVYALNPLFTKLEKSNNFVLNASDTLIVKLISKEFFSKSEIEPIHLEHLNDYVDEAFDIMKTIDVSNITSVEQLYAEQIIPYCASKNIDSILVKKRLNLVKRLINEPIKNFKNESNLYAYLAIILYGKSHEFNPLFLSMYRYVMYKKIAKRYYSSKYFE